MRIVPSIRSIVGLALVIVATGACDKGAPLGGTQDMSSGMRDGFVPPTGGTRDLSSGMRDGFVPPAGGRDLGNASSDMAGATGQVCVSTCSACKSSSSGACCGTACCGYGEWCDAATLTCHCGSGAACHQAVCSSSTGSGTCGDYCSPIL